jgi:hypothetical protein
VQDVNVKHASSRTRERTDRFSDTGSAEKATASMPKCRLRKTARGA